MVVATAQIGSLAVTGRFELSVGESYGVIPASWTAIDTSTGLRSVVPAAIVDVLPKSVHVPSLATVTGAVRRAHLAAERLGRTVGDQPRLRPLGRQPLPRRAARRVGVDRPWRPHGRRRAPPAGGRRSLVHRPDDARPVRDVAWSKLVQRAIGNALRTEIARATGISVEFRQLLAWFHSHPEDRAEVPGRGRRADGLRRGRHLRDGQARHPDRAAGDRHSRRCSPTVRPPTSRPGREAAATSRRLRAEGIFVIASRSRSRRSNEPNASRARHHRARRR